VVPRFYAPRAAAAGTSLALDQDESHHLSAVMRVGPGDLVHVFDGEGRQWSARVATVARRGVTLSDLVPLPPEAPARPDIILVAAVLRGDAMDTVVRDATVMGVTSIRPVWTSRTTVPRRADVADAQRERWQRVSVAACKQCGRARLPAIGPPATLDAAGPGTAAGVRLIAVEPGAHVGVLTRLDDLAGRALEAGAALLVGPEGGWTGGEVATAEAAGWRPWSLGPLVLRAEQVPLAALAVLRYAWSGARG
jgi:16S rRNA (uracil1498-N3)-methyltransferase